MREIKIKEKEYWKTASYPCKPAAKEKALKEWKKNQLMTKEKFR